MRAGFSKVNITPRIGVELYGFGPFENRTASGVRDILEARTAAFEANGKTVVIISVDLCMIQAETVALTRSLIREKHPDFSDCDIMVNTSHTHSGPATLFENTGWGITDEPWFASLPYKLAKSAEDAFGALEDAEVSQALVPCRHIGLNRVYDKDAPPLEDVLKDDWEPEKPELTNTECRVIRFNSVIDGSLKGFMAYFGCHPVVCSESGHSIHGDYPGVAMHCLMREFPGSVGMFLQGAEGDINSGCVHKGAQESLLALDVFAARFANAVRSGLEKAERIPVDRISSVSGKFRFTTKQIFKRTLLNDMAREQEARLLRPDADDTKFAVRMAAVYLRGIEKIRNMLSDTETLPDVEAELHIIRMGDLQFMGAPFEVMSAIKNDVHAASSAKYPMMTSLTNGAFGYAPDNVSLGKSDAIVSEKGNYEAIKVPLIAGRPPYADIHNELVRYMTELEKSLSPINDKEIS